MPTRIVHKKTILKSKWQKNVLKLIKNTALYNILRLKDSPWAVHNNIINELGNDLNLISLTLKML